MTEIGSPEIESHGISRAGKVREDNQDAIRFWRPDDLSQKYGPLYGIADGMGGYAHGGVASSLALETFFDTFYKSNGISVPQKLRLGVQNANMGIYQAAQRLGVSRMGTTLTVVNLVGKTLNLVHVGDSRAYLIRDNLATCLTNDHTRVGEMVRMRMLSPEKVRTHAQRSVLEKCLGVGLFVHARYLPCPGERRGYHRPLHRRCLVGYRGCGVRATRVVVGGSRGPQPSDLRDGDGAGQR